MPATSYHHGDLRNATIALAHEVVAARGHDALVMRELATTLGVSIGALYRHFADRNALMLLLANDSHAELLEEVNGFSRYEDPWQALRATAAAVIEFAQQRVRMFRLMYADEVVNAPDADAQLPAQAGAYRAVIALFRRALPEVPIAQVRLHAITFWSTVFGYASLCAHGGLPTYSVQGLSRKLIEQAVIEAALQPAMQAAA